MKVLIIFLLILLMLTPATEARANIIHIYLSGYPTLEGAHFEWDSWDEFALIYSVLIRVSPYGETPVSGNMYAQYPGQMIGGHYEFDFVPVAPVCGNFQIKIYEVNGMIEYGEPIIYLCTGYAGKPPFRVYIPLLLSVKEV